MRAQRGSRAFRAEVAALLEQRHAPVHVLVESARHEMGYEDEPIGRVRPDELVHLGATASGVTMRPASANTTGQAGVAVPV
ncbi:hypothetical protein AAW14_13205 [Streptomyces hygroscopicus]|nr:hypothetical protein [Streptomyces hygroscopicus]